MVYDPAWDMPRVNWQQQGSFEIPEIPPTYEPDAEPLVCLPPINQYWLPYVMGALDQLRNPSSWLVADDDAMYNTLARVTKLREMIGTRAVCMTIAMRVDGCNLQFSVDGGDTWTTVTDWSTFLADCIPPQTRLDFTVGCELQESFDGGETYTAVPGWDTNFGACVQANVPIIGLPPNPGGETPTQFACSIASYLANEVILNAMQAGVTAITDDLTLLTFGANVLTLIPEFILVKLGYDAVTIIYTAIAEGTLSDYEAAVSDGTLWNDVTCAIFSAIEVDGYVTPGNFDAILTNVSEIPYAHADVTSTILSYLNSLGAVGLAQLSQRAGLVVGADCSECGTGGWCTKIDFAVSEFGSSLLSPYTGTYTPGVGWVSGLRSGVQEIGIQIPLGGTYHITAIVAEFATTAASGGQVREGFLVAGGVEVATFDVDPSNTGGSYVTSGYRPAPLNVDTVYFVLRSANPSSTIVLRSFELGGDSTPLGTENCTYPLI